MKSGQHYLQKSETRGNKMRHFLKNKAAVIEFYEKKILENAQKNAEDIQSIRDNHKLELQAKEESLNEVRISDLSRQKKQQGDREIELRGEHRSEILGKDRDHSDKIATMIKEQGLAMRTETIRVENKLTELERAVKKQAELVIRAEKTNELSDTIHSEMISIQSGMQSEFIEMKMHYLNMIRQSSRANDLIQMRSNGRIVDPHATMIKETMIKEEKRPI